MNTYCTYKIFSKQKVIVEKYWGKVTWSEILELKKKQMEEPLYDRNFNVILDGRNADLKLDRKGMMEYVINLIQTMPFTGKRKSVIITNTINNKASTKMLMSMLDEMEVSLYLVDKTTSAFQILELHEQECIEIHEYIEKQGTNPNPLCL